MCGRFSFVTSKEKIKQELGEQIETDVNLRISFNIAPTQHAYVITNEKPDILQYLTWGLIPYWAKDEQNASKLINARQEGISSKPSFRIPIRQRRCVVIADSFYEWKKRGADKVPYRIFHKNGNLLMLAGIWDIWYKDNYAVKSFSIITTPPNEEMSSVHNRMPIILDGKEKMKEWLSALSLEETLSMLKTPEDGLLDMYPVSNKVNNVRNNGPDLHQKMNDSPTLF